MGACDAADRGNEGRDRYLARAAATLSTAGGLEKTVRAAAALPVPWLADWCALDLVGNGDELHRQAVCHRRPQLEQLAWRGAGIRATRDTSSLREMHAELWRDVPDSLLAAVARDETHLADLRRIGTESVMIVPLRTLDETIGVMALGCAPPRRFGQRDLELAQDIGRRCATAIRDAGAVTRPA